MSRWLHSSAKSRDQGKKREKELFNRWGGNPSVLALSFAGGYFDSATVKRVHRKINELDANLILSAAPVEEAADPERVRSAYESANELLLSQMLDRGQFPLVFAENVNFGYRRNLWAMKPAGLGMAVLGVVGDSARLLLESANGTPLIWTAAGGTLIGVVVAVFWVFRVTPGWVRLAAVAYARQLVRASQSL